MVRSTATGSRDSAAHQGSRVSYQNSLVLPLKFEKTDRVGQVAKVPVAIIARIGTAEGLLKPRTETRHPRRPLILQRPIRCQRPLDRSAGNPHDPADLTLRVLARRKQVASLRPIIQIDHHPSWSVALFSVGVPGPTFGWRQQL